MTPIKSRHSLASSLDPMSDSRFSAGVISKRTEPELDTPPRPPVVANIFKITLSPVSGSRYFSCNCCAFCDISITYLLVTSNGVPVGSVKLTRTVSLGIRGKNTNLVQPLVIMVKIIINTPTNKLTEANLWRSAKFKVGW